MPTFCDKWKMRGEGSYLALEDPVSRDKKVAAMLDLQGVAPEVLNLLQDRPTPWHPWQYTYRDHRVIIYAHASISDPASKQKLLMKSLLSPTEGLMVGVYMCAR